MNQLFNTAEEKMNKTVAALEKEYGSIRAGRANPAILDRVTVDYYGTPTPIIQMAAVSVPEARMLQIQPWDASTLKEIEKAILASDIGITPANDGKIIRISFPPLTEERRKELVKDINKMAEDSKVAIRSIRRDVIDKLKVMKKNNEITEDDVKKGETDAQKLTDKFVKKLDEVAAAKEKEVMSL
ncbi:MAG: ribosome recycling factor [Clostridia bacterium]|nr:ribosome recycling factor [Clostridia bacterium]MBQ2000274.1 ribosome recycling factor [Clostridia bacterium]MBQ2318707.1 ribosome recycling factor [Clostridia bacterium]MBQ2388360.1 ribosome recycling factor [Clostridia bacterium]